MRGKSIEFAEQSLRNMRWFKNNSINCVASCDTEYFNVVTFNFTLELSNVGRGFSPPLQISHNVVPKLHLSAARHSFTGSFTYSGGTQGILSIRTDYKQKQFTKNIRIIE